MPTTWQSLEKLISPPSLAWLRRSFSAPTPVQKEGWRKVAAGEHTLMCAPTGSGKTLAAFFICVDRLANQPSPEKMERCRVLYVSPLKALTVDVDRNLRAPLKGVAIEAQRLGLPAPDIRVAVRSGDTPVEERRSMQKAPPDILITTPESLYLLLTSAARQILTTVEWVILDEIHTMVGTKRGAHLAVSLERLSKICHKDPQRIGLSATQRPLQVGADFLGGRDRKVAIVDAGQRKTLELTIEVPVEEMVRPVRGDATDDDGKKGMWPAIEPRLLDLIRAHRSTIVFVNSRRRAERLAGEINELAGTDLVKTHHGSISKEQRLLAEEELKSGRLPALIATSSLELGIDMGAVDLVVLVGSPQSVASGLQRIGRAGHNVGDPSKGILMPLHRGDLLESAAVVTGMLAAAVETTRPIENPIDVLAQQIVAMVAMEEWDVDELRSLVMRAQPFTDLGQRSFDATLDMLSGRYPSDEFTELRPRVVWDRSENRVRARAGAQHLAVISGGTIPDRGLYTVHLLEDGRRVGELDEEMVYELRPNQTFILGATTWRVAEITPSQVLVTHAPGEPGTLSFWHGDAVGRPVEVGRAMGALTRELAHSDPVLAAKKLETEAKCDPKAARNLVRYLWDEREATGTSPDDRTIVVESFRDQLGDWRVCVLSCFGARVHTPWALAVAGRLRNQMGMAVEEIHSDDGFALRFPEAEDPPPLDDLILDPDEVRDAVLEQLTSSALFASRFRENAARALLLPRRRPGQRTPLWQQRQRSADLLKVASHHPDFPIIIETVRECLNDVFDMEALTSIMKSIRSRQIHVKQVTTDRASPFATSLVFDYIAQYMYEGDAPLAERRAQALTLDSELLAELLGNDDLSELIDPDVAQEVEIDLQCLRSNRHPNDADAAVDMLQRLGDLTTSEALAREVQDRWLDQLSEQNRIIEITIAEQQRWIAVEDASRYRDILGVVIPSSLPESFLEASEADLASLLNRWARSHLPFTAADVAQRFGLPVAIVNSELERMVEDKRLHLGHFAPVHRQREYTHPDVLRLLRRRSLAKLRHEIEPVSTDALVRFLPEWHGIGERGGDLDVLAQLEGASLPASVLERDILPARIPRYATHMLDALLASGEFVWVGRGSLGKNDGRIALYRRDGAERLIEDVTDAPTGLLYDAIREFLRAEGACFFNDLRAAMLSIESNADELARALWEMVWGGEVTNDSFVPVRAFLEMGRSTKAPSRRRLGGSAPLWFSGRWSLVDALRKRVVAEQRMRAVAEVALRRHGVLTREGVLAEGILGGFVGLYPVLRAMEDAGKARRGYFVEGLGGSQFALPGAVDRLRDVREVGGGIVALAATDPANPFGSVVPWPELQGNTRPTRVPGAYVVIDNGYLRAYLQRGGRSLLTTGNLDAAHLEALSAIASRAARLEIREIDGMASRQSALAPVLGEAGFSISPKGLVRWPEQKSRYR